MSVGVKGFFIVIVLILGSSFVTAQTAERTVKDKSFENAPATVVGKFVGQESFKTREKTYAEKDWLKNFAFEVQNVSGKQISSIHFLVEVQKQGTMSLPLAVPVVYFATKESEVIKPGEVVLVKFPVDTFRNINKLLEKDEASDVEKVILSVRQVYFVNNTRWVEGIESKMDPKDPNSWIRISGNEPNGHDFF